MKRNQSLALILAAGLLLFLPLTRALADSSVMVHVEVINALAEETGVDPALSGLAEEVGAVLNYRGFKLLKESRLPLRPGTSEELLLFRDRRLVVTLEGFEEERARLALRIYKSGAEIFATTLVMADNGSAIIGGPKLEKGVMLLRIRGEIE